MFTEDVNGKFKKWITPAEGSGSLFGQDYLTSFVLPSCINNHIHLLDQFLVIAENERPNGKKMCGLQIQWQMLYGEGVILSHPQNLLLDTFQRRCWEHTVHIFDRKNKK